MLFLMLTSIVYPKIEQTNFFLLTIFEVTVGLPLPCTISL